MRSIEIRIDKLNNQIDLARLEQLHIPSHLPHSEYMRLMGDILVLALQSNLTNVATFMFGAERWNSPVLFDGVFDKPVGHHALSHNQNTEAGYRTVMKIDVFYMQQYAYMADKMARVKEADGSTLLDNTLFHYGTAFGSGATHQYFDIPSVIMGGKNLGIKHGDYIRRRENTPLTNLWLTYAQLFGMKRDAYGDSDGNVSELLVGGIGSGGESK